MKKFVLGIVVIMTLIGLSGKESKGQVTDILDALGKVEDMLQKATTTGTTVGNYVTLTKEFKETYAVVEEMYCLKRDLQVKLDFANEHFNTCYFNVRYRNYITSYNSTVRSLKLMVSNLRTMVKVVSTNVTSGGETSSKSTVMQTIDMLNKTQKSVNEMIDFMKELNMYVDRNVANQIRGEMLTNYRTNVGQYELILD